jgi:hypothetical protein
MKDNMQRSSKVLLILVLAMYINETVVAALNWYLGWLAYVKYSGSNDQALAVILLSEDTPLTVLNINGVTTFMIIIRLGIADSIMVILNLLMCFSAA